MYNTTTDTKCVIVQCREKNHIQTKRKGSYENIL